MEEHSEDAGVIQVLLERLEKQRIPRLLAMKERVDKGEPLPQLDIEFLSQVFEDAGKIEPLLARNPEWQPLAARVVSLYKEITDKALENEKAAQNE